MGHDLTEQMRQSLEEILAHYDTNEGMLDAAWNSANGEASSLASAAQQVQGDINTEQNFRFLQRDAEEAVKAPEDIFLCHGPAQGAGEVCR